MKLSNLIDSFETIQKGFRRYQGNRTNMSEDQKNLQERIFNKMRYALSLNLALILTGFLAILLSVFIYLDQPATLFTGLGFFICVIAAIGTYVTKNYKVAGYLFAIAGPILVVGFMNTVPNGYHVADPLWMIIVALFAYFVMGKRIGNLILIFEALGLIYYVIFNLNDNINSIASLAPIARYALSFNILTCSIVITYLVHLFLKRNAIAVAEYENILNELKGKNILVQEQNREKTSMLKEIHHLVKNNLQVITSLLRLQSREIENQSSLEHFKKAIDRISAMTLIHNQMYQSKDLDRIALEPYFESLSKNILHSYALDIPVDITFDIKIDHAASNNIVPMALIFNELMSNSFKYAFQNKSSGAIRIKANQTGNKSIEFNYADNGEWIEPAHEDSCGLELIEALTEQLGGTVKRSTTGGTHSSFIFESESL